jgi:large subunit ribosomal protein L29
MPSLKPKELRNLTEDELKEKLEGLKKELFSLRLQAKFGKLEKHASVQSARKDIARVKTLIQEKAS